MLHQHWDRLCCWVHSTCLQTVTHKQHFKHTAVATVKLTDWHKCRHLNKYTKQQHKGHKASCNAHTARYNIIRIKTAKNRYNVVLSLVHKLIRSETDQCDHQLAHMFNYKTNYTYMVMHDRTTSKSSQIGKNLHCIKVNSATYSRSTVITTFQAGRVLKTECYQACHQCCQPWNNQAWLLQPVKHQLSKEPEQQPLDCPSFGLVCYMLQSLPNRQHQKF